MPPPDELPRFAAADLRRFFTAVDAHLPTPATITVIGGSAIALYGVSSGTTDIDTLDTKLAPLQAAIDQARVVTSLNIPVVPAPVADVPYHSEDRLQPELGPWTRLTVLKLEPHDLALSKAVRGFENDFAAIEALHQIIPLDLNTLVTRYLDEMGQAIGDPAQLDVKFALMIERLYGDAEAERVEARIRSHRERRTQSPPHRR